MFLLAVLAVGLLFVARYLTHYISATAQQRRKLYASFDPTGHTAPYTKTLDGSPFNVSFDPTGRDSLVFIHIPKTGGSEFLRHLVTLTLDDHPLCLESAPTTSTDSRRKKERAFCPRHLFNDKRPWLVSEKTLGWYCGLHPFYSEYKSCISAETALSETRRKFDPMANFHYSTMLRHPVLRYISEYLHVQRGATFSYRHICGGKGVQDTEMPPCFPGFYDHRTWDNVTLSAFLSCDSNWANNRQTYSVADLETVHCFDRTALSREEREQKLLQSAKDNLRRFSFFGITEYMVESSLLFEATLGLKFGMKVEQKPIGELNSAPMLNVLWNTPYTYDRIAAANHLDLQLYEYALELFASQLKAVGIKMDTERVRDEIKLLPANSSAFKGKRFQRLNYALDEG